MDSNLDRYRTVIDKKLMEIKKNLELFPEGRHRAYFALLSVHQLATDTSEIKDRSKEIKLLLGHEISERISQMLYPATALDQPWPVGALRRTEIKTRDQRPDQWNP